MEGDLNVLAGWNLRQTQSHHFGLDCNFRTNISRNPCNLPHAVILNLFQDT